MVAKRASEISFPASPPYLPLAVTFGDTPFFRELDQQDHMLCFFMNRSHLAKNETVNGYAVTARPTGDRRRNAKRHGNRR